MPDPCSPGCRDNCPFDPNNDQVDTNGNGIGDVCEPERH